MGDWLRGGPPLAASLLGHIALVALVAGAGWLAGPAHQPDPAVIAVRRAPDAAAATRPPLRLETAGAASLPPDEGGGAAVALDTADPRYRPYLTGVKRRIWERWDVPAAPRGRPVRGTLVVEFTLTRSGRVDAAVVSDPSGVPAYDSAALAAVARAGPYPPLPASIVGSELRVRARFVYD